MSEIKLELRERNEAIAMAYTKGYQQGRADFIAEHTQINAYGKPFILISSDEYEQLKEQNNGNFS